MNKASLPSKEIIEIISKSGRASTSFLTLYSGFEYFKKTFGAQTGIIAYVDTPTAWVAASDPILSDPILTGDQNNETSDDLKEKLILDFFKQAHSRLKVAVMLPVSKSIATRIRAHGYFALQIGNEPWFSLKNNDFTKSHLLQKLNVAKQLTTKGGKTESFDPIRLNAREHVELEELTQDWLESRKFVPLWFLNRLEPWVLVDQKRYFRAIFNGRQVGYLAAIPIHGRKAWYLVDLIRANDAPLGTTELLIAEAFEQLKKEGYEEVTLGMSPLAEVDAHECKHHSFIYAIMNFSYHRLNFFYNFKSLFIYKEKFKPTHWEPSYLLTSTRFLGLRGLWGLFRALLPDGILLAVMQGFYKSLTKIKIEKLLYKPFSNHIILRTLPRNFFEFIFRSKITLVLIAVNVLFYVVANDQEGNLRERFAQSYGYQMNRILWGSLHLHLLDYLVLPSFLHWSRAHLISNMLMLCSLVGLLELLAGSLLVAISFLLGMIFTNLITSLFLFPWVRLFSPSLTLSFSAELDVGSSLGIFACVGAFVYLFKKSKTVFTLVSLGVVGAAIYQSSLLSLNHITAMMMGYILARFLFPKELK